MGFLRLLLALTVVAAHSQGAAPPNLGAVVAVQMFYMISGFLITLVLHKRYEPGWEGTRRFYLARWWRIWIPYAVVAGATVLAMKIVPMLGGTSLGGAGLFSLKALGRLELETAAAALFANLFLFGQDIGLLLAHSPGEGLYWTANFRAEPRPFYTFYIMDQSWTLGLELAFYVIAPFLVRRSPWVIALVLACSLAARMVAAGLGLDGDPWTYRFFPFELALFMAGALAAKAYLGLGGRALRLAPLLGGLALALVLTAPVLPLAHPALLYPLMAALLPFLFAWTSGNARDRFLGELSYPVYLVHVPLILVIRSHPVLAEHVGGTVPVVAGLSLAAALALRQWVEKPVDRFRAGMA